MSRETNEEYHTIFVELLNQPVKFSEYFRMSPETFSYILNGIEGSIPKQSNFTTIKVLVSQFLRIHDVRKHEFVRKTCLIDRFFTSTGSSDRFFRLLQSMAYEPLAFPSFDTSWVFVWFRKGRPSNFMNTSRWLVDVHVNWASIPPPLLKTAAKVQTETCPHWI